MQKSDFWLERGGGIVTVQLTYGDRMGTANHDMEWIKGAFSPQNSPRYFQVVDKFISLEI